jgi:cytoskeletal protein RodZ
MKQKDFDFSGPSRSNQRAKRRKTNLILNSLIAIVILLIIIVSFTIFFSDGENASTTASGSAIESTDKNKDNEEDKSASNDEDEKDSSDDSMDSNNDDSESDDEDSESDTESDDTNSEEEDTNLDSNTEKNVVTTGGSDSNVKETITNPDWQPVGTAQTGEHVPVYDSNSTDWKEMEKAISYGTGLEQANMTLWFLGRNKEAENQSVATVSSKDNSVNYRVYIEWIDGQGWKPVLVEELYENDKR